MTDPLQLQRDCEAKPEISRTARLLHGLLQSKSIYEAVPSPEMRAALASDVISLKAVPECIDAYFGIFAKQFHDWRDATAQLHAWTHVLEMLRETDPAFYENVHKGSAFYWVAVAAYFVRDFPRAAVYMDAAFGQDLRSDPDKCLTRPAGLFVTIQADAEHQWAQEIVRVITDVFEEASAAIVAAGGSQLTVAEYRGRFIEPALRAGDGRRSIMTAFVSFLLEYHDRQLDLEVLTPEAGSRDPAFLHLFKGALVLESLLRMSRAGQAIVAAEPKATLNKYLTSETIWRPLGFTKQPDGMGTETMDELIAKVVAERGKPFLERAIRAAWGIRNSTGHNLAWPTSLTAEQHRELALLLFGAISEVILKLYP